MEKQAVADASSLIFIAKLKIFHLVKNIFSHVLVPEEVLKEILQKNAAENEIIKDELNSFLKETKAKEIKEFSLGLGEKEAISLCLEKKPITFLSEDKKARKFSKSFGIETIGVIAILFWNLERKKITKEECEKLIDDLIKNGYYMSPHLYSEILRLIKGR